MASPFEPRLNLTANEAIGSKWNESCAKLRVQTRVTSSRWRSRRRQRKKNRNRGCRPICGRPSPPPQRRGPHGRTSRPSREEIGSTGSPPPNSQRLARVEFTMLARCSQPGSDAFAVLIVRDSTAKASALPKRSPNKSPNAARYEDLDRKSTAFRHFARVVQREPPPYKRVALVSAERRSVTGRAHHFPTLQSSQASDGFHKPFVSGAAPETATISLLNLGLDRSYPMAGTQKLEVTGHLLRIDSDGMRTVGRFVQQRQIIIQACVGGVVRQPCVSLGPFCASCRVSTGARATVRDQEIRADPILAQAASWTARIPVRRSSNRD
jgi:hypothetical protein